MTLLEAPVLSDHVLVPVNVKAKRSTTRNGWECRVCHEHWDDLPPIAERLRSCPVEGQDR